VAAREGRDGACFFPPAFCIDLVGLTGDAPHHVGGRRRVQVRLHAMPDGMHLLAGYPQFTGQPRSRFTFGDAAEQEHQGCRALTGLRERCTGQQGVVAIASPIVVGGKVVLLSKQPPIAASTSGAALPLRVQMAFQPDQADAVV
jgi:hypothetical protein